MLAIRKLKSYEIPENARELIAVALEYYCTQYGVGQEADTLAKMAVLFRSPEVSFSVAMSTDTYGEL